MKFIFKYLRPSLIAPALLVVILGLIFTFIYFSGTTNKFSELKAIEGQNLSFSEYADFFENLAKEKGGKYAFNALGEAHLPPGTDFHLLGHVIGDVLYKQKGVNGIYDCTHDFRNACSHSIVTGVFEDYGPQGIESITEACEHAPGGKGAYAMCFHGLGHGVLAYSLYDLEKAVSLCGKVGSFDSTEREAVECVGGTIMEMVGGGDHDKTMWEKERPKYIRSDKPLSPCNSAFMPLPAQGICYSYLIPHLLDLSGVDFGNPDISLFPKALSFCSQIPEDQKPERDACYGGFGKEFLAFVNNRDIRTIGSLSDDDASAVGNWCLFAGKESDVRSCQLGALSSLFWGGEINPDGAFKFCSLMEDNVRKTLCYSELTTQILYYSQNPYDSKKLCERLPEPHRKYCLAPL